MSPSFTGSTTLARPFRPPHQGEPWVACLSICDKREQYMLYMYPGASQPTPRTSRETQISTSLGAALSMGQFRPIDR